MGFMKKCFVITIQLALKVLLSKEQTTGRKEK